MPANSSIDLTTLDFDSLKESFKTFLGSQEIFRDYDLEGSNINLLTELLSYNTFKNAFLTNMLFSEAFLDSAQLRNSIISHAKELNYVPRSLRSSRAKVRVSFSATSENAPYIIPKGKPFTTIVKNHSYTFTTPETIICSSPNNSFTFTTDIFEGSFVKDTYTFAANVETQLFKTTNKAIDTRSLTVSVYEDNSQSPINFRLATSLLDVDADTQVFFIQPAEDETYEILFGDNNIGRRPKDNSIITLEYRVSQGQAPNGAKTFSCDFDPTSRNELLSNIVVDVLESAREGAGAESLESIRYYAPRHFQVQERAVTASDYEISLKTEFPEINAVHAYGGEELDPPQFGRVIISIDISEVSGLPESKKTEYYRFLKRRSPFTIDPVFIEPEFSYISINSIIRYNLNVTPLTSETIKSLVSDSINRYQEINLNKFNAILRQSKLAKDIDNSDQSIVSSITGIAVYKKINPELGVLVNIETDFNMPIRNDIPLKEKIHSVNDIRAVYSSVFRYKGEQCIFEDNGNGIIRLMKIKGSNYETIQDIGSVNYESGEISIQDVLIDEYFGDALKIYVLPDDPDIAVSKNTILAVESDEVHITVEELRQ